MNYIFTHGMGQGPDSWNNTITKIQEKIPLTATCPDLWNFPRGEKPTYQDIYTHFVSYLDKHAAQGPLNLCGLSFGGMLSLNYTQDHPEKVASLILIGARYSVPVGESDDLEQAILADPELKGAPPSFLDMLKSMHMTVQDFLSLRKSMEGLDFEQKLSTISCPTLVLCGENDSEAFIDAYELFAKNIPGVSHALINNAGHFINEENPTDLASKISEFLLAKNN